MDLPVNEKTVPSLELPLGKAATTTMDTVSNMTFSVVPATTTDVLQSLTMLAQTLLVRAGIPLPDPNSVLSYSLDTTAAVLVK